MTDRRNLGGLAFFVLAGVLAWGGTVDPAKASLRWIAVGVLGSFGIMSLLFDRMPWFRARDRIERVYLQMIMLGLAIGAVAWLIPASESQALLAVAGLLVLLPPGVWVWGWFQRRQAGGDDANRPG